MDNYQFENYENIKGASLLNTPCSLVLPDEKNIRPNNNKISQNQRLAGKVNPKTLIQPVITPPIADLEFWRANNLINHSHINSQSQYDTYLSGYNLSNVCYPKENLQQSEETFGTIIDNSLDIDDDKKTIVNIDSQQDQLTERYTAIRNSKPSYGYEGFEGSMVSNPLINKHLQHIEDDSKPLSNQSGWMNIKCGYDQNNINKYNLPSNLSSGEYDEDESMKTYNKNLFTQTIQPGVHTVNEIIEPINTNIGISFTQQFQPVSSIEKDGDLIYRGHDPRLYKPTPKDVDVSKDVNMSISESDVYDPRFTGYGTSYRSYTDNNTGQPRFYYDDINSVRMPNYIVRSNIDFANYADSYGTLNENNKFGNKNTADIRKLAQDTFLEDSLKHRNEMMERLMRKRNTELWETRKYPIRTFGGKK
jgi:hypothetical protein